MLRAGPAGYVAGANVDAKRRSWALRVAFARREVANREPRVYLHGASLAKFVQTAAMKA